MNKLSIITAACFGLLAGCASVVSTNETAKVPVPSIASTDSLADIEIKELVKGQGCVTKTLGLINSGDKNFLSSSGQTSFNSMERAKAAATYNALSKDGLSTDILVNPVWEIHNNDSFFVSDVCARVVGYRGVIKGFKQMQTVTRAPEYKAANDAPIEKRATNSHFAREDMELEKEVIIHEESHPAPKKEELKAETEKSVESKQVETKHEDSKHSDAKHPEAKHGATSHSEEKVVKKPDTKKSE
jgi:hypothetical protein